MTQTADRTGGGSISPESPRPPKHRKARRPLRMPRVPTVMQMESVECGAACLAMILAYYGKFVPLEELRRLCGVSRDGAKASTMLSAARSHGLTAKGIQAEAEVLKKMTAPVVIFWAFQHFMVVEGVRRRYGRLQLRVNDPAAGQRWMEWTEFETGFTGIILQFEKGPDFTPSGSPVRVMSALLSRRLPSGRALPLVLLASIMLTLPGIVSPGYSKIFIDSILGSGRSGYALPLVIVMVFTAGIVFVLTSVQQHYLLLIETRLALTSSARFMRHLLHLPINFFMQRRPAEVARRVSSNDVVAEILSRDLAQAVINLALVGFYAIILFRDDLLLTGVGLSMVLFNLVVLRWVSRIRTDAVVTLRADRGSLTAATFTSLSLIETIKATGAEADAFNRWAGFLAKVTSGRQRLGVPTAILVVVPPLLAVANTGLILLVGGLRVVDGAITVGLLVAFQTLLAALSRPVQQLTNLGGRLQDVTADIKRLHDVEQYPIDPTFDVEEDATQNSKLDGSVEVRDVTFAYSPLSPPVLENVSLRVEPGHRIAIVGGSGSGKSTIGQLLTGLYQPSSGQILLDGRPRAQISRAVLAASVASVDQIISFFEATVRENLTMWDPEIPDRVVIDALEDAEIFDVVNARPGGINSMILEDGRNYSGGQRQRLDLARALASQPSLLILDEATSALDPETERAIMDNLRRRGCACITVAHRLSTIRDADEIVVLDRGRVVERGTHQELVGRGGAYAALVESDADVMADIAL